MPGADYAQLAGNGAAGAADAGGHVFYWEESLRRFKKYAKDEIFEKKSLKIVTNTNQILEYKMSKTTTNKRIEKIKK